MHMVLLYVQNAFGLVEFYWSETKLFGPKHGTISLQILIFEPCPESCVQSENKVDYLVQNHFNPTLEPKTTYIFLSSIGFAR